MQKVLLFFLTLSLAYSQYTLQPSYRERSAIDRLPKNSVADMRTIPQDPAFYANQIVPMSREQQLSYDREYNRKYFRPWKLTKLDIPSSDFGWEVRFLERKPSFTRYGKIIPSDVWKQWIDNANYTALNTQKLYAITTTHTNLHALPTEDEFYRDPAIEGEGFPFDYNQNSAYYLNTPLFISHFSKDKQWAFVQGSYAFGWVRMEDIALVDRAFIQAFERGHYAMSIKDNLRLFQDTKSLFLIKLGTFFPYDRYGYMFASKRDNGYAKIERFHVTDNSIIAIKPLKFTAKNVAKVAREFYNEPYGWGGNYHCRDCSATTRDFLGVFGIFLRRNSSKQAKDGQMLSIKNIPTKEQKKAAIIANAKPFRSLLFVPGHIVLYLGVYNNEPIVMHTYWGIRKTDLSKLVTARTIITTTEPGRERSDIREASKLIYTLKYIVNF
ncbi:MAG: SH3 domain-containing protein [Campylobacterales bacterium]|nr:SH3 domain-containing protein [Campylobacterales bacterium]